MDVPIKDLFQQVASEVGFKKKGRHFYRTFDDVQHVIVLRKSRWGSFYAIWLGISIRAIAEEDFPPVRHCHVQCAAENLVDNQDELAAALNEENYWRMDDVTRRELIKLALTSSLFSFFSQADSVEKLRGYLLSGPPHLAVTVSAKSFLKLE